MRELIVALAICGREPLPCSQPILPSNRLCMTDKVILERAPAFVTSRLTILFIALANDTRPSQAPSKRILV